MTANTHTERTALQQLRDIESLTDILVTPNFLDELDRWQLRDGKITIWFTCFRTKELPSKGWTVTNKGVRMIVLSMNEECTWSAQEDKFWDLDPEFKPFDIDTYVGKTVAEYVARTEWENEAYRWGNGSRFGQRDSYERISQGMRPRSRSGRKL